MSSTVNNVLHALLEPFSSISEGIRLASDYKALTTRGVAPDVAVRHVFEQIKVLEQIKR